MMEWEQCLLFLDGEALLRCCRVDRAWKGATEKCDTAWRGVVGEGATASDVVGSSMLAGHLACRYPGHAGSAAVSKNETEENLWREEYPKNLNSSIIHSDH